MNDDLISREALKAHARKVICGDNPTNSLLIRMFDEIIDNAPAEVELVNDSQRLVKELVKGEWIPVSERLPQVRDWYLGLFKEPDTGFIGVPFICDYVGNVTKGTTKEGWILRGFTDEDNAHEYYKSLECVAWHLLPEPYKEGDTE